MLETDLADLSLRAYGCEKFIIRSHEIEFPTEEAWPKEFKRISELQRVLEAYPISRSFSNGTCEKTSLIAKR